MIAVDGNVVVRQCVGTRPCGPWNARNGALAELGQLYERAYDVNKICKVEASDALEAT